MIIKYILSAGSKTSLKGAGFISVSRDGKIALNIGNIYYSEPDEKRRTTANLSLLTWQQLNNIKSMRFMGTIYWQKTT